MLQLTCSSLLDTDPSSSYCVCHSKRRRNLRGGHVSWLHLGWNSWADLGVAMFHYLPTDILSLWNKRNICNYQLRADLSCGKISELSHFKHVTTFSNHLKSKLHTFTEYPKLFQWIERSFKLELHKTNPVPISMDVYGSHIYNHLKCVIGTLVVSGYVMGLNKNCNYSEAGGCCEVNL